MTAPSTVLTVPSSFLSGLVDTGLWQQRRVTHWHCVADEQPINVNGRPNDARFDTYRITERVDHRPDEIAKDPRDALDWLVTQWLSAINDAHRCPDPETVLRQRRWHTPELWRGQVTHTWEMLINSVVTPVGFGLQIRPNLSLDAYCYPMTIARCRRHG